MTGFVEILTRRRSLPDLPSQGYYIEWQVVVVQLEHGNERVEVHIERAVQHFKAVAVLFVGVAGGPKDVRAMSSWPPRCGYEY